MEAEPEDYREQRELDRGFVERPTVDDLADMERDFGWKRDNRGRMLPLSESVLSHSPEPGTLP